MCFTATASMMAFVLILIIAFFLIYRNQKYDRVAAALLIIVSLVQLIEYLRHKNLISIPTGGRAIFLILWLQLLVLTWAVYFYLRPFASPNIQTIALILAGLYTIIFVGALFVSSQQEVWSMQIGASGHMEWTQNGGPILGSYGWLYFIGLLAPWLLLQASPRVGSAWRDWGLWFILGVLILTFILSWFYYPGATPSLWCYMAVAVAFAFWLAGAFA